MPYKTLLFDLDDTLFDFKAAEKYAISSLMKEMAVTPTEENIQTYSQINQSFWNRFEKGLIKKDTLLKERFETFFQRHQLEVNGNEMDIKFRSYLEKSHFLIEDSTNLLDSLFPDYDLYAVTNGVSKTQYRRLSDSGLDYYFKDVFVSEDTGFQKPMLEYFNYVFKRIPNFKAHNTLIIGDSLTSDILGGQNAGIDSCWFNPHHLAKPAHIKPTYQITDLKELTTILN